MLIIRRRRGESIVIGEDIEIEILVDDLLAKGVAQATDADDLFLAVGERRRRAHTQPIELKKTAKAVPVKKVKHVYSFGGGKAGRRIPARTWHTTAGPSRRRRSRRGPA